MATLLESYKNYAEKKGNEVSKLYNTIQTDIITHDLRLYYEDHKDIVTKDEEHGEYRYADNMILDCSADQSGNPILEIDDRRGTAFLWVYTPEIDGIKYSEMFYHNKRLLTFDTLKEDDFSAFEWDMVGAIADYERSVSILKQIDKFMRLDDGSLDTGRIHYHYECVKPETEAKSIEDAVRIALERDYE